MGRKKDYSIYCLVKGYEEIAVGTIFEIAQQLNIKPSTVRYYSRPVYQRKAKNVKNRLLAFKID